MSGRQVRRPCGDAGQPGDDYEVDRFDADGDAGLSGVGRASWQRPKGRSSVRRVMGIIARAVIALVLIALVAAICGFSYFRWLYGDDASDFQGTWYVQGTGEAVAITITGDAIVLNDEVSYEYVLNTESKTVAFVLSYMEGGGRYRFSVTRDQLAIADGSYSWWSTLAGDIAWTARAAVAWVQGEDLSPAFSGKAEDDVTLLTRASDAAVATSGNDTEAEEDEAVGELADDVEGSEESADTDEAATDADEAAAGEASAAEEAASSADGPSASSAT